MENGYPCDCRNSPFVTEQHVHVITGNIYIVSNEAPRGLISKGPKFREQNKIAWGKNQSVFEAVKGHSKLWGKREKGKSQY